MLLYCVVDGWVLKASAVKTYQKTEVVDPQPGVTWLYLAQPGGLVDHLFGCDTYVRHSRVGQGKRHTDPLKEGRTQCCGIVLNPHNRLNRLLKKSNTKQRNAKVYKK